MVFFKVSGGSNNPAPFSPVLVGSGVLGANWMPCLDPCILNAEFGSSLHHAGAALMVSPRVFFFFFSGRLIESEDPE